MGSGRNGDGALVAHCAIAPKLVRSVDSCSARLRVMQYMMP